MTLTSSSSLKLEQSALPAPTSILSCTLCNLPFVITTSHDSIHILDESAQLIESISFRQAFPHSNRDGDGGGISVISVDETTNRIVVCLNNRFAVFEPTTIRGTSGSSSNKPWSNWRVHSSLTIISDGKKIESIDFKRDLIILQIGNEIRLYSLREEFGLAVWKQISDSFSFELPLSHLRLLPPTTTITTNDQNSSDNEWILAILPKDSSTCLIYDLIPTITSEGKSGFKFFFRSKTVHSIRLKSIDWRIPSTSSSTINSPSDSGPILMTTSLENSIHLWGCVIDQPKEFSLWISIPSPPPSPPPATKSSTTATSGRTTIGRSPLIPIDQNSEIEKKGKTKKKKRLRTVWSGYWKTITSTRSSSSVGEEKKEDLFWSLLENGQFYLTTVSNLDSRPPTCLTSQTKLISPSTTTDSNPHLTTTKTIPHSELYNFRSTCLLKSRSNPLSTIHLISFSSTFNSLLHTRLDLSLTSSSSSSSSSDAISKEEEVRSIEGLRFKKPFINYVGYVRKLIKSFPVGENLLVLGNPPLPPPQMISTTTMNEEEVKEDRFRVRLQSWEEEETGVEEGGILSSKEENVLDLNATEAEEIGKKRVASWFGGRRIVVGEGNILKIYSREKDGMITKLLIEQEFEGIDFDQAKAFFVVRRFEDDLQTWIIAVTKTTRISSNSESRQEEEKEDREEEETMNTKKEKENKVYDYELNSWIYHSPSNRIFKATERQPLTPSSECEQNEETIVWVSIVPPPLDRSRSGEGIDSIELQSCDSTGCVKTWRLDLTESTTDEDELRWKVVQGDGLKTGRKGVRRTSSKGNGVIALATDNELSIWNERNCRVGTALEFSQTLEEEPVSLEFSIDTKVLALASLRKVLIFIQTRRESIGGGGEPGFNWTQIATIELNTPFRITNLQFHSTGLAIACESQLFFHSFKLLKPSLDKKGNKFIKEKKLDSEIRERGGFVGLLNERMLTRLIEFGHFEIVLKFFKLLSRELDEDGKPIQRVSVSSSQTNSSRFGVEEVLEEIERKNLERNDDQQLAKRGGKKDLVSSLSTAAELALRKKALDESNRLTPNERSRLVICLERGDSFKGLSKQDHFDLVKIVQIVCEVQPKLESIDSFGVRYLSAIRNLSSFRLSTKDDDETRQVPSRDILFAYYSKDQQSLLDETIEVIGKGKLSWEQAREVGIPLWLKDRDLLSRTIELIGKTSFLQNPESRDPILPTLFYLALRKLPQVLTFWKQSLGHSDQRLMLKFLGNDFDQERWRLAAKKNAFALLSKRRFLFAAGFFLLGDSLTDSISVILKHLKDPYLAIAIARTYETPPPLPEGGIGPVLRDVLKKEILPNALKVGDRFLSCWSLELLGEGDLSKNVMVEFLTRIDFERFNLGDQIVVNNPVNEDSSRVVFVQYLLENGKGGTIGGRTEFEFVLYIARQLCESGFHLLAIDLVRSYKFSSPPPTPPPTRLVAAESNFKSNEQKEKNKSEPTNFIEPDTSSLFDMLSSPPSSVRNNKNKEVEKVEEEGGETEEERQKRIFREASGLGGKKVESKSTVEAFSFDAFGF
ncbi:hypothetical protein JCM5350_000650 [Sporobolomyces pararoseus]